MNAKAHRGSLGWIAALFPLLSGCSNGSEVAGVQTQAVGGGPAQGPPDLHCMLSDGGVVAKPVNQASCMPSGDGDPLNQDGGMVMDGGMTMNEPDHEPRYGNAGDDDDCKYRVTWSASPIGRDRDVSFYVTVASLVDGAPVENASMRLEVFLDDTHPAQGTGGVNDEKPGGEYSLGPIRFDTPGRWTMRIHIDETCSDEMEDSPHGHAAFYIDVL